MFRIISYYTPSYKEIAEKYLLPSVKNLNLSYYIPEVANLGDWEANTNYKPVFIKDCLGAFEENLIWADCDATINSYPDLFNYIPSQFDIAIHFLEWKLHYPQHKDSDVKELASGTIFFRNNFNSIDIVNKWIENTKITKPDQKALEKTIKENNISYYNLPRKYCYVLTHCNGQKSYIPLANPIISHHQISRTKRYE